MLTKYERETINTTLYGIAIVGSLCVLITLGWLATRALLFGGV
jgi:hypothetical protein